MVTEKEDKKDVNTDIVSNDEEEEDIEPEIVQKLPPEARQLVREIGIFSGPMQNPLAKKIQPGHIDKLLDYGEQESVREHDLRKSNRLFRLAYVLIAIVAFILFTYMFADGNPELYKDILTFFGTFAAGFGVGWGFNAYQTNKSE